MKVNRNKRAAENKFWLPVRNLLCIIWLLALPAIPAAAQSRGVNVKPASGQVSEKRIALVIGNGDYVNARKLGNPANDAADMAGVLNALGFEVISGTNLSLKQMTDMVREFGDKLKASGGVGLFYYAGHGIQVNGRNYLIPIEADISREDEIDFAALNFDQVLRKMATANNGLNIVILDACRNNPFARSWSRDASEGGLAQVTAPTGTFIAYATSPDRTASDGNGRNGLYTQELLKVIKKPNIQIEEAFKEVTIAVDRTSSGRQTPWVSSSLRGDFYFRKDLAVPPVNPVIGRIDKDPVVTAKESLPQEKENLDSAKNGSSGNDMEAPEIAEARIAITKYNDYSGALNALKTSSEESRKKPSWNFYMAAAQEGLGNFAEALKYLEKYNEIVPNQKETVDKIGELRYKVNKPLNDLTRGIESNPNSAQGYSSRGDAYYNKGDYELSIRDYSKSLELSPGNAQILEYRGDAYNKMKKYDLAISDYTAAIALKPKSTIYVNRGNSYDTSGNFEAAMNDYNKAIELDPKNDKAYFNRGIALYAQKRYSQALPDFQKALQLNSSFEAAKTYLDKTQSALSGRGNN